MKERMSIKELKAEGYQESYLRELAHRDIYSEIGWRNDKKRSKIYFDKAKLDAFLQTEMNARCPG